MKSLSTYIYLILSFTLLQSCASEEKVMHRLEKKKLAVKEKFRSFKISCTKNQDFSSFYSQSLTYKVEASFEETWAAYTELQPKELWAGPLTKYKEGYSKIDETGYVRKETNAPCPDLGSIYEIKLRVIPLVKFPINFEITQLSKVNKIMEFTYGGKSPSKGKQTLTFVPKDGYTLIIHDSYFKSGKKLRDQKLYPFFHEKYLNEFHQNVASRLKLSKR